MNHASQTLYDMGMSFDRGDRAELQRLAKELVIITGHLSVAIAGWYFPSRSNSTVDRSRGLFPPSAP